MQSRSENFILNNSTMTIYWNYIFVKRMQSKIFDIKYHCCTNIELYSLHFYSRWRKKTQKSKTKLKEYDFLYRWYITFQQSNNNCLKFSQIQHSDDDDKNWMWEIHVETVDMGSNKRLRAKNYNITRMEYILLHWLTLKVRMMKIRVCMVIVSGIEYRL